MKIGILQTGHAPEALIDQSGDYDAMFQKLLGGHGFEFETFDVVDMEFPDSIDLADGWLITGSKHGAYEDHAFIPPLEGLIRDVKASGKPMIGVCFGHQIIAQALGGKVEKFDGGWSIGHTEYRMGDDTVAVNAWHQDQVVDLPSGATVTGSSDFCANAALVYDDQIWTLQPHPEFEAPFVHGLINTRGPGVVPDDQLSAATERLDKPIDSPDIGQQMAAFFKQERNA